MDSRWIELSVIILNLLFLERIRLIVLLLPHETLKREISYLMSVLFLKLIFFRDSSISISIKVSKYQRMIIYLNIQL